MTGREMNVRRDKSLLNMTEFIALFNHCPGLQSGVDEALINRGFSPISFSELAALFLEQIYTLFIVRVRYGAGYGLTGDSGLFLTSMLSVISEAIRLETHQIHRQSYFAGLSRWAVGSFRMVWLH